MPLHTEGYIAGINLPQIQDFLREWQLDQKTGGDDLDLDCRLRRWCETDPDSAVSLLIALAERNSGPRETTAIAEGLEWFLIYHGKTHWDVLNVLCQSHPRFREVMANVWSASLSKDLKRKVEMWQK